MKRILVSVCVSVAALCSVASGQAIEVISWNVESGGADPDVVAERITALDGVAIWGLCEVRDETWAQTFRVAAGSDEPGEFSSVLGTTGNTDRLLVLFDRAQFTELRHFEIGWEDRAWYRPRMRPRSALVVQLRHDDSGQEFFFMVNHLYRGRGVDERRLDQAVTLNAWAGSQTLPVIAVGDYNFDYDLDPDDSGRNYEKGLGQMTAHGVFTWLEPDPMITTHDSRYNSILDFVFLANAEGVVTGTSDVVQEPGDFPDSRRTPDHRPVRAYLTFGGGDGDTLRDRLLRRIADLQRELDTLREIVERIPN